MILKSRSHQLCFLLSSLIVSVTALCHTSSAMAQERNGLTYSLSGNSVYDSNPLTRSDDLSSDEIIGMETTASVVFKRESAKQSFDAEMALTRNQFNVSAYNSNDASFIVNARKEIKRWFFNFAGDLTRDTTRATSVDTRGQSTSGAEQRTTWSVSPSIIYNYAPLNSVGLNMNWTERAYEDIASLTDYRTYSLSPFISRQVSPRQSLTLALQYQHYNALNGADVEVDSVGPFLTWAYKLRRNLFLDLSLGFLSTKYDGFATSADRETNPIYSASLEYEGQKNTASLSVQRARQALSNGAEIDTITARIANKYAVTPRWRLDFSTEYTKAEQSSFSNDNLDARYRGTIGTTYDISRKMKFSTSYENLNESYTDNSSQATRSIIRAGIDYSLH